MLYIKTNISIPIIIALLAAYILSLNFAVSETFYREELQSNLKILRQDLQKNEEFFISRLSEFYGDYSEAFAQGGREREEFVSRRQNFAEASRPDFR